MALKSKSNFYSFIYYLFILSKTMAKGYVFLFFPPPNVFSFVNIEPGLSQKTFLRSRQEMPNYLKHSKIQEPRQRPTELLLERLLLLTLRSTTTSIKPLTPPSLNLTEMPRPPVPSTLKTHQKLPLLLELEGKF